MGSLHERNISLWIGTTPETTYPPLSGEVTVDVAVIGAGITGLSTAALLKRAGARVAVIEAGRVASGVTGYTTAKVSSLHGLTYASLEKRLGPDAARTYGEANQSGIAEIARLVTELAIDCDFERLPAFTYTEEAEQVASVEAEVDAARRAGLAASFTSETDLP